VKSLFQIALVAVGSAAGGLLRWGIGAAAGRLLGTAFPYGTFIINLTGCLFLGWFFTLLGERLQVSEHPWLGQDDLRLLIAVGFTGAYTTFSTFEWEASSLFRDSENITGTVYLIGSVVLGLLAIRLGVALAKIG
jgi:fluoride exporter